MVEKRLKELRKALGLTQAGFGKELGVSRDIISNYENGRVAPREIFLELVCRIFSVNRIWLLEGEGPMFFSPPDRERDVEEGVEILRALSPHMRPYALKLIRDLLELQESGKL